MQNNKIRYLEPFLIFMAAIVFFVVGVMLGSIASREDERLNFMNNGFGYYEVNPITGKRVFVYELQGEDNKQIKTNNK